MNPLAFYMDVHIPSSITKGLMARGLSVLTAQDDGRRRSPDDTLLDRATTLERILVTQDQDFHRLAAEYQTAGTAFCGVAFLQLSDTSPGEIIEDLEIMAHALTAEEIANRIAFLPFLPRSSLRIE